MEMPRQKIHEGVTSSMKLLFENWRKFVKEVHAGDKADGEVQAKYRSSFKHSLAEDEDNEKTSPD